MFECVSSSIDLWSDSPKDIGLHSIYDQQLLPLSGEKNATMLEFSIPGDSSEYVDLSSLTLYLQVEVQNQDSTELGEQDEVSLINLWPAAMFKQVDLSLGHTIVSSASNTYPYRAYIESLLSYSEDVKNNQLNGLRHFKGTKVSKNNSNLEAILPLHLDLAQQNRYLLNGVETKLKLTRASNDFIFKASTEKKYKLSIKTVHLFVRKVVLRASTLIAQAENLNKQNAIYLIDRTWIKPFNLAKGINNTVLNNVFLGELPSRLIVAFVKSDAFNGNMKMNPFEFKNFDVDYLSLQVNGHFVPQIPYTPDFEKKFARREYQGLLETTLGDCFDKESIGITYEDFLKDKAFFGFTLQPGVAGPNQSVPPKETGYINLHLKFKKALEENVTCLIWAEFQNTIEIDSSRNIYTDFTI